MNVRPWPIGRIGPVVWLVLLALAMAWDRAAWVHLSVKTPEALASLEGKDWYRALRVLGFFGTWAAVGVAMLLIDLARVKEGVRLPGGAPRRAVVLILSVICSAMAAEAIKFAVGRMRPEDTQGWYAFMPLARRLNEGADLGMPSSHAAAAFGATLVLCVLFRPAAPVFLLGAVGCSLTRVLSGAHFVSDAVAGAWVAYAVSSAIWRIDARNNGGVGLGESAAMGSGPEPAESSPAAARVQIGPPADVAPRMAGAGAAGREGGVEEARGVGGTR